MKKAPTILQVIPWLDSGGVERGTVDIAAALTAAGAPALVAAEPGRLTGELEALGGRLLPIAGRSKNPLTILHSNARRIEKMIRQEGVDLVHARSRAPAWSALIAARRAGVPFVTTYHGAYGQKSRIKAFYNSVMTRGDVVIANSHYTARLIAGRDPSCVDRITTIHRGVDMAAFDPARVDAARIEALRSRWGVDERPVLILPSRLTRWKGQSFILPVIGALKRAGIALQLVLIGDDQGRDAYVAELDRLIAEQDIADRVYRVGHCADMPAAYRLADLVVIPSQDAETFGRSAAESLAMGTPALVGDLGAQPEVAAPPQGIGPESWMAQVVPHADTALWQDAITRALATPEEVRQTLVPMARSHVADNFSLASMGRQTLAVYDRLLGSHLVTLP